MPLSKHDLENDRASDEAAAQQATEEQRRVALSEDIFEGYFNGNGAVIEWVDEYIANDPDALLKMLRDNFTQDGLAMRSVYLKYISRLSDELAEGADIEKVRDDYSI